MMISSDNTLTLTSPHPILALDIGTKSCGLAKTDALGITRAPVKTLFFKGLHDLEPFVRALCQFLKDEEIKTLVVGLPLNRDKEEGHQAKHVRTVLRTITNFWQKNFSENFPTLHFIDETGSTQKSWQILETMQTKRSKREDVIDAMSALVILNEFLDG